MRGRPCLQVLRWALALVTHVLFRETLRIQQVQTSLPLGSIVPQTCALRVYFETVMF